MLDSFRQEEICLIFWNIKARSMGTGGYGGLLLREEYASRSTGSTELRSRALNRATIDGAGIPICPLLHFTLEGSVPSMGTDLYRGGLAANLPRPERMPREDHMVST